MNQYQFDGDRIVGPMGEYYATVLDANEMFRKFLIDALNILDRQHREEE